jgi:ubiquinone/menaquinone biosynthesis C-methylase UbiE
MKNETEKIIKEDFDKYSLYGAYHFRWYEGKEKYRIHIDRVKDWIKEKSVIDIGAGEGVLVSMLGINGIDSSEKAVELARSFGIFVDIGDACSLPYRDEKFESAYMGDTLEHIKDPSLCIREARRVIRKYLYIATPLKSKLSDPYEYNNWTIGEFLVLVEREGFKTDDVSIIKNGAEDRAYVKFKKI